MDQKLLELKVEALNNIEQCDNLQRLNDLRVEYLGKKGFLSGLSSKMGQLLPEERATFGKKINEVKTATGRKGKDLFHPVRMALTGEANGPELKTLLPLIGYDKAYRRLKGEKA